MHTNDWCAVVPGSCYTDDDFPGDEGMYYESQKRLFHDKGAYTQNFTEIDHEDSGVEARFAYVLF